MIRFRWQVLCPFLTGQKPEESVNRVSKDDLQPPSSFKLSISNYFDAVLGKGLQLKFEKRIQTATEFVALLRGLPAYRQKLKEAELLSAKKQYQQAAYKLREACKYRLALP